MTQRPLLLAVLALLCACHRPAEAPLPPPEPAPGYVGISEGRFAIDGEPWFPLMLNYAVSLDSGRAVPAPWYTGGGLRAHFDTIASWGFNAVRVCVVYDDHERDSTAMYRALRHLVQQADSAGLHVMMLLRPPFEGWWRDYAAGLMRSLADLPALWAYDLMNEPLYFDPEPRRSKRDAARIATCWGHLVRRNAPHQLFTIALAEPIEVFEWDPALLPTDFVEMHTYHPLRVQSEMWWYARHCGKPWMVGETGLPADDDSVPYAAQAQFMRETYAYARRQGAIGYGWWEFQDCPEGANFEAQYTGLRDAKGKRKPAAGIVRLLQGTSLGIADTDDMRPPVNYHNMLAYTNLATTGTVVDTEGRPICGAVVRGWNDDWSVGMNTYTDAEGRFRLVSNDLCTHFELSAPGYSNAKFNRHLALPEGLDLPDRSREYQRIPLLGWGCDSLVLPQPGDPRFAAPQAHELTLGTVGLTPLTATR